MNNADFQLQGVGDPRLAVHATGALPAWLWSVDGTRIFWANPVGARLFGAANGATLAKKIFGPADARRRQVAKLAGQLPSSGAMRLQRLRGFGAPLGMLVSCGCARLEFADGSHGILVVAVDPIGRAMPLVERLQRLVEGIDAPIAAFARDGTLVGASDAARPLLGFRNLFGTGLDDVRDNALKQGRVETAVGTVHMVLQRVGSGADVGLIALIAPPADRLLPDYEQPAASGEAPAEFALMEDVAESPAAFGAPLEPDLLTTEASASPASAPAPVNDIVEADLAGDTPGADLPAITRATSSDTPETPDPIAVETSHQPDLETPVETPMETPMNVLPFRPVGEPKSPVLTPVENSAFNELARQLSARLESEDGAATATPAASDAPDAVVEPPAALETTKPGEQPGWLAQQEPPARGQTRRDKTLLDLLPVGVLIYRLDRLVYANPAFLTQMGYESLYALEEAGGLDALYVEPGVSTASSTSDTGTPVTISASQASSGHAQANDARLYTIAWDDDSALALIFSGAAAKSADIAAAIGQAAPVSTPSPVGHANAEELGAILDTTAEGIVMFDAEGNINSCNRSAEALFGHDGAELVQRNLAESVRTGKPARGSGLSRGDQGRRCRQPARSRPRRVGPYEPGRPDPAVDDDGTDPARRSEFLRGVSRTVAEQQTAKANCGRRGLATARQAPGRTCWRGSATRSAPRSTPLSDLPR